MTPLLDSFDAIKGCSPQALLFKGIVFHIRVATRSLFLPSAALVTASSGTCSSVNLATDRRIGSPLAMEKGANAEVAAGRAARRKAVIFMVICDGRLRKNE